MAVSNPQAAEYKGVSVEHPRIVEYIKNCKKQGMTKERAQEIVGMPREIIEKHYRDGDSK